MANQRTAVFAAIVTVLGAIPKGKVELSDKQKEQVYKLLEDGFNSGEIELKGERTPEWVKKYVPGLVNNWLRKDENLNGGVEYVAKNPGSRTGTGDEALRAMKNLRAVTTDPEALKAIDAAIDARTEEIKPKLEIKVDKLPEHLRYLVGVETGTVTVAKPAVAPIVRKAAQAS